VGAPASSRLAVAPANDASPNPAVSAIRGAGRKAALAVAPANRARPNPAAANPSRTFQGAAAVGSGPCRWANPAERAGPDICFAPSQGTGGALAGKALCRRETCRHAACTAVGKRGPGRPAPQVHWGGSLAPVVSGLETERRGMWRALGRPAARRRGRLVLGGRQPERRRFLSCASGGTRLGRKRVGRGIRPI